MSTLVTDRELILILLASMFIILIILFIVGKWLNFNSFKCCINGIGNRKTSMTISVCEQSTQEPIASFIDLSIINEPLKTTDDNNVWMPVVDSSSSMITNDTTYDDTPMPNSTSAYDIISYANNIKSTLKRTISCDLDNESIITSLNDLYMTEENIQTGKLQITINYNVLEEYLEILFLQIRDLFILNENKNKNSLELFIIAWLDENQKEIQQSQLITYHKNQAIVFNNSMKWKIDDDHLPCTVLHVSVYSQEKNKTEIIIGKSSFTIGEIYIYQPLTTWLNLHDNDEACWYHGEINISLCYHPTADRLTCALLQARNLTFYKRESISADCYATLLLFNRHQIRKKTRTSFHHATDRNPVFNETSVFNVSSNDLLTSYIRIVIYEIISIPSTTTTSTTKTLEIGHCLIGNHDRTHHTSHWQQMLRVLRRPVIVWHPLKL